MEDECDFDTISAMLDSDDEKCESTKQPVGEIHSRDDSSDDDIDESELDKLACLVENEGVDEESAFDKQGEVSLPSIEADVKNTQSVQVLQSNSEDVPSGSPEGITELEKQVSEVTTEKICGENESSDEENVELAAQMMLLQQQMKLLEKRLNKKKKTPKKSSEQTSPRVDKKRKVDCKAENDIKNNRTTSRIEDKICNEVSTQNEIKGVPSSKHRTLKEFNIFDIMDSEKDKMKDNIEKVVTDGTKNAQPWERKQTRPPGTVSKDGVALSSKPKMNVDKNVNKKLKSTVEKITSKMTSCITAEKTQSADNALLEKDLFGDDSGSDWDDLDGEKADMLSKSGKELNKIINKESGQRIAHKPAFNQESMMQKKQSKWSTSSPSFYGGTTKNCLPERKPSKEDLEDISRDPFSGIRIMKPLVSSLEMKSRMAGRKIIKMSQLHRRINTSDTDSDWVTVGVIVSKSEPKMSSKNTQYSIWKLSDLDDCDKLITMFLFGNVHKELWKHTIGSVVGLLNPTHLKNSEKYQKRDADEVSVTIDNPQKLMLIGFSKDLGTCKSKTKGGRMCNNVINLSKGEYCTYHVQAAYKKTSAKRSELQAGFTGVTPRSFEKKIFGKTGSTVMYGGQSFTTAMSSNPGTAKAKNQISLKALQHHTTKQGPNGKVNTLKVHNLMPEMKEAKEQLQEFEQKMLAKEKAKSEKHKAFHDLLSTPTIGSTNFVKHLAKKENINTVESTENKPTLFVSPSEFLKQAQREREQKKKQEKQDEIHKKLGIQVSHASGNMGRQMTSVPALPKLEAVRKVPTLGRGFSQGDAIELDFSGKAPPAASRSSLQQIAAKKKAIAKIKAGGGIKKDDPNAIKNIKSPESQVRVKRRLEHGETDSGEDKSDNQTPPRKKSRLLGDLDLDDPEVQKVLNAKSSHAAALTQEEQERQDHYFEVLEKKEAMEEKMASITKVKCKVTTCKKCVYTAFSPSQLCKDEGHKLVYHEAWKRYFKCKTCKHRTVSLDKLPKFNCKNCGSSNFEKTTMLQEKKGPLLPGEELLLRGEERKFINS